MIIPAVKFVDGDATETLIEALLMPFGGPFNGSDLYGERFTPNTDFCLDWYKDGVRPLLYHHGLDAAAGVVPVGTITDLSVRAALGGWMQGQLDAQSQYYGAIRDLVKAGKLFLSSGAMAHLVDVDRKSGDIRRWPVVEGSLTPTPANLLATVAFPEASRHYRAAALTLPEPLRAKLDMNARDQLTDADFAYVDSDGGRHLPINDADHVRNAVARFGQTEFESPAAKDAARTRILAAAKREGVDVSEDSLKAALLRSVEGSYEDLIEDLSGLVNPAPSPFGVSDWWAWILATFPDYCIVERHEDGDTTYWRVAYTVGADGDPVLGEVAQVEQAFLPTGNPMGATLSAPVAIHARALTNMAAGLLERTKGVQQRRIKEGRVLSDANRKRLADYCDAMDSASKGIRDLLDSTMPQTAKAAVVRRLQDAEYLSLWAATLPN